MQKIYSIIVCVLFAFRISAQTFPGQFDAQVVGGKEELQQVLETQLTLPKVLLNSDLNENISMTFDLDSAGHAMNLVFQGTANNILRKETERILGFLHFKRTQDASFETYPYSFNLTISAAQYNKFLKQRSRLNLKKNVSADSSLLIYSRADRAPEFYKNGEEGLKDFILSEMEYPKLALEKSVEGTVVIEFIVETNGYVTGVHLKQGLGAGCSEEALRIMKLTKWQPAVFNKQLVRYKMSYPITFSLRNVSRDASSTIGQ